MEDAGDPRRVVFLSDPQVLAASFGDGDLRLDMFRLRAFDELRSLWMGHEPRSSCHWKVAGPPLSRSRRMEGPPPGEHRREGGAWRLVIKHRHGSLEDAVTHIRRHNLAISLGILALLAMTMGLMMVATQRAQRLARQQIEFVAGVTHELNTPLTAIRSAGQNLAAGVVAEPGQVKRYGDLIESEGRRLSDMVGQALDSPASSRDAGLTIHGRWRWGRSWTAPSRTAAGCSRRSGSRSSATSPATSPPCWPTPPPCAGRCRT